MLPFFATILAYSPTQDGHFIQRFIVVSVNMLVVRIPFNVLSAGTIGTDLCLFVVKIIDEVIIPRIRQGARKDFRWSVS